MRNCSDIDIDRKSSTFFFFFFLSIAQLFDENSVTAVYLHVCSYMNLYMVFFTFFQATLHGYVLSNETVDPIIPQLISVVRNDSLLTFPTTPVCSFNRI